MYSSKTLGGVSTGFSQPIWTESWLRELLIVDTPDPLISDAVTASCQEQ